MAGHGDKTTGAVIGGVGGAVIGNQLARGSRDCQHAYGWYDSDGRWHPNAVDRTAAAGYYDRDGAWVDGEPRGHYDSRGVWIANAAPSGWYDSSGQWRATSVEPTAAAGYYDRNGVWVANAAETYGSNASYDTGFSDFRAIEDHIRGQINDGLRDDDLESSDAAAFSDQLRRIQQLEARERADIRAQLEQLDRQIDQTRNEP